MLLERSWLVWILLRLDSWQGASSGDTSVQTLRTIAPWRYRDESRKVSEIRSVKTINYNSTLVFQMCCRVSSCLKCPTLTSSWEAAAKMLQASWDPSGATFFCAGTNGFIVVASLTRMPEDRPTLCTILLLSDDFTESATVQAWTHVCSRNNAVLSCCGAALWMKIIDHAASSNTASKVCTRNKFIVALFVPRNILRSFQVKRMRSRNFIAVSLQMLYVSQRKAFHKHKAIIWYYRCLYAYVPSSAPNIQLDPGS